MATVHLGRLLGAAGFSRTVAIKRLHDGYARDPEFVAMLLDEARLASQIRHPNVVPTLDVVAEHDELLVVMEYIEGDSLAHLAKLVHLAGDRVPVALTCSIVAQALHGLHAAHEARDKNGVPLGIVHRDVSPQNVLVGTDGVARVLDFGIAKAASRATATEDGQIKGKTAYMAPEQLNHGAVDRRTDVWAAAVMFWELLTTKRLFFGDTPAQTIGRVLHDVIDPPTRWMPDLPPELAMICMRGLERDIEGRWESAEEMALAIEDAVQMPRPKEIGAWVANVSASVLESRAALVREVEREDAPVPAHSSTDPALRAALEEAERRRQMADLPTNMWKSDGGSGPAGGTGPFPIASGSGPYGFAAPSSSRRTVPEGPPTPRSSPMLLGPEVTDLATVRSSVHEIAAPPHATSSRATMIVGVLGGLALAGAIAAGVLVVRGRVMPAKADEVEVADPPPTTTSLASASATELELELPPEPAAPSAPIAPSATVSHAPIVKKTPPHPPVRPPAQKQPNCKMPYVIDAKGEKHFKPECL
ncbi:MAG: protein kinase [Labilithrix sp.]|nr:protein kinase [Labilithrix sp.]MCW5811933.1 protein kinase [Labilithrix sp.]